jgi:Leucine-rich repeat (LRR) protein
MKRRINKQDLSKTKQIGGPEDSKIDDGKNLDNKDGSGEGQKNKTQVISALHTPTVVGVLQQNNIPLINNNDRNGARIGNMDLVQIGATGKQGEETKKEGVRKKIVKKLCRTLLLNNNEIRTVASLLPTLEIVMKVPSKLKWLDLSFNYLTKVEPDILDFPELKALYLHGNYIYNLEEVKKLSNLENLISLTLHGNPIEQIPGYRLYALGIMYSKFGALKKLDSVVITRKEEEGCFVWNQHLFKKSRKFPKLEDSKIKRPPQKEDDSKNGDKKNSNSME